MAGSQDSAAFVCDLDRCAQELLHDRLGNVQAVHTPLVERSIAVIEEAPFLREQQKRDVLYNNAARFLWLSE